MTFLIDITGAAVQFAALAIVASTGAVLTTLYIIKLVDFIQKRAR